MDDELYKRFIDELVRACRQGQGQIGANRCRTGVWNRNATASHIQDQYEINVLLKELSASQREVLARMLEQQFADGAFEALRVLYEFQVPPFEDGYEGSPFNDFVGRLTDWEWPQGGREL